MRVRVRGEGEREGGGGRCKEMHYCSPRVSRSVVVTNL